MVLRKPDDEDRSLIDEVGIELGLAESGGGRVQRRFRKVDLRDSSDRLDAKAGYFGGDGEVADEFDVLAAQLASRSSSSRS
jgi:hypothetical protein